MKKEKPKTAIEVLKETQDKLIDGILNREEQETPLSSKRKELMNYCCKRAMLRQRAYDVRVFKEAVERLKKVAVETHNCDENCKGYGDCEISESLIIRKDDINKIFGKFKK